MYLNKEIKSEKFQITKKEITHFAENYDPMFFHLDSTKAQESIFKDLVASGLHSICIILQKLNEFSDWKIATGLEHTVKYLKPVFPDQNYYVCGKVSYEGIWKNPKYTELKMNNYLMDESKDKLVLLDTNFLIYTS